MASLPGIIIKVGAQTTDAIQGLNRVNSALGRTMTRGQKFSAVSGRLGKAFLGIAGAATAAATAIGVDAVQAYIDDQKEAAQLAATLENLGFGAATDSVNEWIDSVQYAANVSETELRPSYARLLRSTEDLDTAQQLLQLSLDISAGTGKDLDTVTSALAKAYDGNTGALGKLGTGLDNTVLKSKDMNKIITELTNKFGGSSKAQAGTLSSSIEGVKIAFDELKESFGQGLVLGDPNLGAQPGMTPEERLAAMEERLRLMQPQAEQAGEDLNTLGQSSLGFLDNMKFLYELGQRGDWSNMAQWVGILNDNTVEADVNAMKFKRRIEYGWDTTGIGAAATGFEAVGDKALYAKRMIDKARLAGNRFADAGFVPSVSPDWSTLDEQQRGARTRLEWQRMEERNRRRQQRRQQAARDRARARAEARAKKKRDRLNAVRNAKSEDEMRRRASTRTGTHFAASVEANRKSCS